MEKTKQVQQEQQQMMMMIMKCPRCDSSNTKFCYYNNYSLSQPRHFCKACKRYWTRGGTLRNVPVGGGCRKNKKQQQQPIKKSRTTTTTTTTTSSSANNLNVPVSVANPTNTSSTTVLYGLPTHHPDLGFGRLGFSFNDHSDSVLSNYNNILPCPNNTGIQESYGFQRPYLVQGSINTMASKGLEKPDDHDPNKLESWAEDDLIVPNSYCQNQMVQINPSIHQHNPSSLYWNPQTTWLDPTALDFSSAT